MPVNVVHQSQEPRPARPVRDRLGDDLAVAKPDPLNAHAARRNGGTLLRIYLPQGEEV